MISEVNQVQRLDEYMYWYSKFEPNCNNSINYRRSSRDFEVTHQNGPTKKWRWENGIFYKVNVPLLDSGSDLTFEVTLITVFSITTRRIGRVVRMEVTRKFRFYAPRTVDLLFV